MLHEEHTETNWLEENVLRRIFACKMAWIELKEYRRTTEFVADSAIAAFGILSSFISNAWFWITNCMVNIMGIEQS